MLLARCIQDSIRGAAWKVDSTVTERIPDVWIRDIASEPSTMGDRFTALSYNDHLLRRFGLLEVIRLNPGSRFEPILREEADEVWVLVEGTAECVFRDLRDGSPTSGTVIERTLTRTSQVFLPFGVAFGLSAGDSGAVLLRVATHQPGPDSPETSLAWEELFED